MSHSPPCWTKHYFTIVQGDLFSQKREKRSVLIQKQTSTCNLLDAEIHEHTETQCLDSTTHLVSLSTALFHGQ